MRILLDTHAWLWSVMDVDKLEARARELIEDATNEVFLSAASTWEIVLKAQAGKLRLPDPPAIYLPRCMQKQGIAALPIQHSHALHVATLPPIHRDPFDRILIAQAQIEDLSLLTSDEQVARYPVPIVWASADRPAPGR